MILVLHEAEMQTDQGGPKRHLLGLRQLLPAKVLAEDALVIAVLVRRWYARLLAVPVVEEVFWEHIDSVAGIHQFDKEHPIFVAGIAVGFIAKGSYP